MSGAAACSVMEAVAGAGAATGATAPRFSHRGMSTHAQIAMIAR